MSISLTTKQKEIIDCDYKYISVIAGAGSGKTRVMTEKIKKSYNNLKPGQKILAITFSNKATEELKNRLISSVNIDEVLDKTYIGTIHNLCNSIISSYGYTIGLPNDVQICDKYQDKLKIFNEVIRIIPKINREIQNIEENKRHQKVSELLDYISKLKRDLHFASDYEIGTAQYLLFKEFDNALLNQSLIDFDDIIRYAFKIINESPSVLKIYQRIYKAIYVDEAQDLNYSQYEIIKLLAGDENQIIMVGDPKQAIYGFNGASSKFLTDKFVKDYKVKTFELNENFRSAQNIINAANKLEPDFDSYSAYALKGDFQIFELKDEKDEANWIVNKIYELKTFGHDDLENNYLDLNNCAIIARNRYVFKELIKILDEQNIPYNLKVSPKGSFSSESDLMRVFELGIRLFANNKDVIHLNELQEIIKNGNFNSIYEFKSVKNLTEEWQIKRIYLIKAWDYLIANEESDVNISHALNEFKNYIIENIDITVDEKILIEEDIHHWEQNWKIYVQSTTYGERKFNNFVRNISLISVEHDNDNGITLSTVHMSKGKGFDVVFIMGLNDGVFPDYRAINSSLEERLIEEKYNLFVAITRSKRLCYITYPKYKVMPWGESKMQSPSRFIKLFY